MARRDLFDPKTAEALSAIVDARAAEDALTLTVADIRAVGPGGGTVERPALRTLYWETEVTLGGGHSAIDHDGRVKAAQEAVRKLLPGWSDPEFDAAPAALSGLLAENGACPAGGSRQIASRDGGRDAFAGDGGHNRRLHGVTAVTAVAPDHPRLLHRHRRRCAAAAATSSTPDLHHD